MCSHQCPVFRPSEEEKQKCISQLNSASDCQDALPTDPALRVRCEPDVTSHLRCEPGMTLRMRTAICLPARRHSSGSLALAARKKNVVFTSELPRDKTRAPGGNCDLSLGERRRKAAFIRRASCRRGVQSQHVTQVTLAVQGTTQPSHDSSFWGASSLDALRIASLRFTDGRCNRLCRGDVHDAPDVKQPQEWSRRTKPGSH